MFFKGKDEIITSENITDIVLIFSIRDNLLKSLYHLIHDVYNPTVAVSKKNNSKKEQGITDLKLTYTLAELENHLKAALNDSSQRVIQSPLDEFQYWLNVSQRAKSQSDRERADNFYKQFSPLVKLYQQMHVYSLSEIFEVIERTEEVYDDVWKELDVEPLYPQDQMEELLDVTGMTLLKAVQNRLSNIKVFEDAYIDVKEALKIALSVCERWSECCRSLTQTRWRNYRAHVWKDDEFIPKPVNDFAKRLKEVK